MFLLWTDASFQWSWIWYEERLERSDKTTRLFFFSDVSVALVSNYSRLSSRSMASTTTRCSSENKSRRNSRTSKQLSSQPRSKSRTSSRSRSCRPTKSCRLCYFKSNTNKCDVYKDVKLGCRLQRLCLFIHFSFTGIKLSSCWLCEYVTTTMISSYQKIRFFHAWFITPPLQKRCHWQYVEVEEWNRSISLSKFINWTRVLEMHHMPQTRKIKQRSRRRLV